MKYISIFSRSNFLLLLYDPKERNINIKEYVTQGCGWESSIRSYSGFIRKMGITLRALLALICN